MNMGVMDIMAPLGEPEIIQHLMTSTRVITIILCTIDFPHFITLIMEKTKCIGVMIMIDFHYGKQDFYQDTQGRKRSSDTREVQEGEENPEEKKGLDRQRSI